MKQTIALLLLVLPLCRATAQDSVKTFLEANKALIGPAISGCPLLGEAFYRSQFFLFGETHGSALPQQYDLALLKHLHQHAGVRFYLAEVDCIKAWMINNYLKDGNTRWLDKVFASWRNDTAQWANREYYNKFRQLYAYQRSLPADKKIRVIGIDVPQDYGLTKEYAAWLLSGITFHKYQPLLDSLPMLAATAAVRKELIAFSKRLLPLLRADPDYFKKKLGKNYGAFQHLVTSLTFIGAGMSRDSVMYRNLMSQLDLLNLRDQKMYGSLGFYHCLQVGYNLSMPFAALLKQYGHTGRIASLQMFALDCKTMLPYTAQVRQMMPKTFADKLRRENASFTHNEQYIPYELSNDNFMMKVQGVEVLRELSQPDAVYLFRLEGAGSPFNDSHQLAEVGGFQPLQLTDKAVVTTRAFQYIILFRNSNAATPLE